MVEPENGGTEAARRNEKDLERLEERVDEIQHNFPNLERCNIHARDIEKIGNDVREVKTIVETNVVWRSHDDWKDLKRGASDLIRWKERTSVWLIIVGIAAQIITAAVVGALVTKKVEVAMQKEARVSATDRANER